MSIYTTQQEHITRTGSPIIMTELNNCKLCYSGETVNCHIALDDVFSFKSFDEYVRSRFRIDENEDVRYEIENREIIPSPKLLANASLIDVRIPNGSSPRPFKSMSRTNSSSSLDGEAYPVELGKYTYRGDFHIFDIKTYDYHHLMMALILLSLAVSLAPRSVTNSKLVWLFDILDDACAYLGIPEISNTEWRTLFVEAYTVFVCRSFTELFIRRAMNPENDWNIVFKKFTLDAVFGAIAASLFVFIRKMVVSNLK